MRASVDAGLWWPRAPPILFFRCCDSTTFAHAGCVRPHHRGGCSVRTNNKDTSTCIWPSPYTNCFGALRKRLFVRNCSCLICVGVCPHRADQCQTDAHTNTLHRVRCWQVACYPQSHKQLQTHTYRGTHLAHVLRRPTADRCSSSNRCVCMLWCANAPRGTHTHTHAQHPATTHTSPSALWYP